MPRIKMAEIGNSEREEGELSEAELSDISSEEEYLLRQRLQVLENYNNVLERKEAKLRSSDAPKANDQDIFEALLPDLSEISGSDIEKNIQIRITNDRIKRKNVTKKPKTLKTAKRRNDERKHITIKRNFKKITKKPKALTKSDDIKESREKHKRKLGIKQIGKSSDESDYEYRNKRRKLQNAVKIDNVKTDFSTLKTRIMNMLADKTNSFPEQAVVVTDVDEKVSVDKLVDYAKKEDNNKIGGNEKIDCDETTIALRAEEAIETVEDTEPNKTEVDKNIAIVVLSTDEDSKPKNDSSFEIINMGQEENNKCDNNSNKDVESDDDLEILRQHALKTKSLKDQTRQQPADNISDSEDSDTTELRLICLRSSLLKKAMEMKQKKKLRKRIATMSSIDDVLMSKLDEELSDGSVERSHGNTDIESMDMDTGISDGPDSDSVLKEDDIDVENAHNYLTVNAHKLKKVAEVKNQSQTTLHLEKTNEYQHSDGSNLNQYFEKSCNKNQLNFETNKNTHSDVHAERNNIGMKNANEINLLSTKDEDVEEDEDLLRAKLLNSLTRNLDKLTKSTGVIKRRIKEPTKSEENSNINSGKSDIGSKRFVINIGESDSASDNETTENLKKMHMKLSENNDFEKRLDMFLKSARKEAEQKTSPKKGNETTYCVHQSSPEKFVPKALNHLPKSGQLEYKRLVKRMAELEKLKQARQALLIKNTNTDKNVKITIKSNEPRTVVEDTKDIIKVDHAKLAEDLEVQIALSRKRIAAESSKVLKLKEDSNKLSQKYKMVLTELRNVRTAMTYNKKELNMVQALLTKMRSQHQMLLNRSTLLTSSNVVNSAAYGQAKPIGKNSINEQAPFRNLNVYQSVKVSIKNDLQEKRKVPDTNLAIQIDVSKNKKTVTVPKEIPSRDLANSNQEKENYEPFKNCIEEMKKVMNVKKPENENLSAEISTLKRNENNENGETCGSSSRDMNVMSSHKKDEKKEHSETSDSSSRVVNIPSTFKNSERKEHGEACSSSGREVNIKSSHKNGENEKHSETCSSLCKETVSECEKTLIRSTKTEMDDYTSPLAAIFSDGRWNEDPHGVLCPYEVGGTCNDAECEYLHPQRSRH